MIEKRAFLRVPFTTKAILTDMSKTLLGRVENISVGGAMVRFENDSLPTQLGNYSLTIHVGKGTPPLHMVAEVACISFPAVGLRFNSIDHESKERLETLISEIERNNYVRSTKRKPGYQCPST